MYKLAFLSLFLSGATALGASCCGTSAVAPAIISGDDRAQITTSLSFASVIGDAPDEGLAVFRGSSNLERATTLKLDGAYLLSDRWQVGATVPFAYRSRQTPGLNDYASGVGDIGLTAAYEALPELVYSPWKPRAFVFSTLTLPTGTSAYQSTSSLAVDALGRGFYSLALGGLALKSFGKWDVNVLGELHRSLPKTFSTVRAIPGWGASLGIGGGYNVGAFRFGLSLTPSYEEGIVSEGAAGRTKASYQLVWSTAAQLSYLPSLDWSVSATYVDQTLVGPAVNVALNRTVGLVLQKRWGR